MKRNFSLAILLLTFALATSCGSTPKPKQEQEKTKTLIQYSKAGGINVDDAKIALSNVGFDQKILSTMTQGVAIYHITYNSTYRGDSVVLSGFIAMPNDATQTDTLTHIQYNHGMLTPFENTLGMGIYDTPSLYSGKRSVKDSTMKSLESRLFGMGLASNGFFVSIPDYYGYGETQGKEHPFLYTPELEIEARDMAIAAREFAHIMKFSLDSGLYLSGWSEGGSVALAQHRFMEANNSEVPVLGTAVLSGIYDAQKWAETTMASKDPQAMILSWVIYSHLMNKGDTTVIKTSDIWAKPIKRQKDAVDKLKDKTLKEAFTPNFLKSPHGITSPLLKNSDNNTLWVPKAPIHLHHGDNDDLVGIAQSKDLYLKLQKNNADSIAHTMTVHQNGNHWTPLADYFLFIVETFKK